MSTWRAAQAEEGGARHEHAAADHGGAEQPRRRRRGGGARHEAGHREEAGDEGGDGAGLGEPEAARRPRRRRRRVLRSRRPARVARRCRSRGGGRRGRRPAAPSRSGSMAMASVAAPKLTSALRTPRSLRSAPCSLTAQSAQSMPVTCSTRRSPPSSPGSGRERSSGPCACAASGQWSSQWAWAPARRANVSTASPLRASSSKLTTRRPRETSGSTAWMPSSRSSSRPTSSTQPPHSAARGSRSESSRTRSVMVARLRPSPSRAPARAASAREILGAVLDVLARDVQQHADVRVVGRVEDHLAGAPRAHEAVGAQHAQVVADVALAHLDGGGEVADAELAGLDDGGHQPAAALVGQDLEDGRHLPGHAGRHQARAHRRDPLGVDDVHVAVVQQVLVVLAADHRLHVTESRLTSSPLLNI